MTRSALIRPEALDGRGGELLSCGERKRRREVVEIAERRRGLSRGAQPRQRPRGGYRREDRDGPSAVGYFDRLAGLDAAQQLACALAQLTNTDTCHVLLVAQNRGPPGPRSPLSAELRRRVQLSKERTLR